MPFTVNGFGTSVCGGRGNVGWGSYDAVEWVVAFMMPVIPIKCVHTFDWNGSQYRQLPIRWSGALMMHTFLNRWLWGFVFAGVIVGVIAFVDKSGFNPILLLLALFLIAIAAAIGVILRVSGARDKKIRLVLGGVTIGNCDPANFTEDTLRQVAGNPSMVYDVPSYARAAEKMLEQGSYAQAMWAARLCVAVEDASEGEALTDAILSDPKVAEAIEEGASGQPELVGTDAHRRGARRPRRAAQPRPGLVRQRRAPAPRRRPARAAGG